MAITGTGTEQDPYIVTTIGEVLEKCAETGAYVCLANDIYVKEDLDYREGISTPFVINCTKFYSENTGTGYKNIYGFRCDGYTAVHTIQAGANTLVDHIGFLSFFTDKNGINSYNDGNFYDIYCDSTSNFTNCSFSMFIARGVYGAVSPIIYGGNFTECSFYIKCNKIDIPSGVSMTGHGIISPTKILNSYICLKDIYIESLNANTDEVIKNVDNSTINVQNLNFKGIYGHYSSNSLTLVKDSSNVICYMDIFYTSNSDFSGFTFSTTSSALCVNFLPGSATRSVTYTNNGSFYATKEQMQDRQFLLDNGFI